MHEQKSWSEHNDGMISSNILRIGCFRIKFQGFYIFSIVYLLSIFTILRFIFCFLHSVVYDVCMLYVLYSIFRVLQN